MRRRSPLALALGLPAAVLVLAAPARPAEGFLEITVEPRKGTLSDEFTITLHNRTAGELTYDPCASPLITEVASGRRVHCPDPAGRGCVDIEGVAALPPGGTLTHLWQPRKEVCIGPVTPPGIYEVRWEGFPQALPERLELTAGPGLELRLQTDSSETSFGSPFEIRIDNTAGATLTYNRCCFPPRILDPLGNDALCVACPECFAVADLFEGESLEFDWTPGKATCQGGGEIPGRYRIIWGGFWSEVLAGDEHFGEGSVLVLPPEDRRMELTLSAQEARPGDVLRITAANRLGAPVWFSACCSSYEVLLIDSCGVPGYVESIPQSRVAAGPQGW